jgi:hypothetical protein
MSDNSTPAPDRRKGNPAKKHKKPNKPYPNFPLTPHVRGQWIKEINCRIHYFGRWAKMVNGKLERVAGDGWREAVEAYQAAANDLHAGRTPRISGGALTIVELCDRFLVAKERQRNAGELGLRAFAEYKNTTDMLVAAFGRLRPVKDLAADDFERLRATMAERWGPVRLGTEIQKVRTVFKYGYDSGL